MSAWRCKPYSILFSPEKLSQNYKERSQKRPPIPPREWVILIPTVSRPIESDNGRRDIVCFGLPGECSISTSQKRARANECADRNRCRCITASRDADWNVDVAWNISRCLVPLMFADLTLFQPQHDRAASKREGGRGGRGQWIPRVGSRVLRLATFNAKRVSDRYNVWYD